MLHLGRGLSDQLHRLRQTPLRAEHRRHHPGRDQRSEDQQATRGHLLGLRAQRYKDRRLSVVREVVGYLP